jgi:Acetoacetate decarboxylase (ADC)
MAFTNPERTQYQECAIWVGCLFQGTAGQFCLQIWVSNDFTLARGWFMGFAKRLGQIYLTEYHPLNPRMPLLGPGAKMKGYVCAHGKRLIEGTLEIEKKIACEELPRPMGLPIFHIRHFPSIVRGAPPSVSTTPSRYREGPLRINLRRLVRSAISGLFLQFLKNPAVPDIRGPTATARPPTPRLRPHRNWCAAGL